MPWNRRLGRLDSLSWVVFAIVLVIAARLFYLQVLRYPHYRALQSRQVVSRQEVPARRGRILDRHGRPLAFDIVGYDVSVVKKRLRPADVAVLAEILDEKTPAVRAALERGGRFVTLRRGMTLTPAGARRLGTLPGVCLQQRTFRQYAFGTMAAQVLGFPDAAGHGVEGIEKTFDADLRGEPGEVVLLEDEDGDPIGQRSRREPVDGADVVLTLDADLQMIADAELRQAVERCGARGGAVLIVEPRSNEILACASAPAPASRDDAYDPDVWRNRAVSDLFEPGSTLKPLTAAAALRRGIVGFDTHIYAERGAMRFG
jgi:cell division protein FtsI (penicillin-binding protein 3)